MLKLASEDVYTCIYMWLQNVHYAQIFYPITTDLYDRKNMPRVIYCIHALRLAFHMHIYQSLTLVVHVQEGYGTCLVCVCEFVCLSVTT